jgi:Calx-beta domain/Carboxypeptidase regulatory-like domain
MKRYRSLIMPIALMLAFGSSVLAATVIVPAANTNTTSNRKPFGSFFGFERTAAIYTAAEHGMASGSSVTDVCWFVNSVATPDTVPVVVYMSTTAATTFTASTFASEIAGASTVFTGTILNTSLIAGSFRCVAITPFPYASGNLKIMVESNFGGGGNETSAAKQFRWSAGASQTWQADTTAPAGTGTISTTSRPNIQLMFNPPAGPGTLQFSSATYGGNEGTTATITVNRVGGMDGAVSVNYATSNGTATGADYTTATGTLNWAAADSAPKTFTVPLLTDLVTDPAETVILTLSSPVGTTITGTNPATLTITDVPPPFNGTYTVGTGGNYPSLTQPGGLFEALNLAGATGPVNINIISDLTGETGANPLSPVAGNPAITIRPAGVPRTISGIAPIAVIRINGADNITIDGSIPPPMALVGGNPTLRQLTVQNLSTLTSSGIIHIGSGTESSIGNTVKNVTAIGSLNATGVLTDPATLSGITTGGATPGSLALFANNGIRIENCSVQKAVFGIAALGVAPATLNTGTVITQNDLTGTATNRIRRVGIYVTNDNGVEITENSIGGIDNTGESADAVGIGAGTQGLLNTTATTGGGVINAMVARNKINGVSQDNTFSAAGIVVAGITGGTNTIANNMITGVISDGDGGDMPAGIFVTGVIGSTTRLFYNSISMTGDRGLLLTPSTAMFPSYGIAINGVDPTVELKNNVCYTTQTATAGGVGALSYVIGTASTTFVNQDSNFNDFWSTGANDGGFRTGSLASAAGTSHVDLAAWNTATTDDPTATSLEVDPMFINPLNNLRLPAASPLIDKGVAVSVLDDIDGTIRSVVGLVGGVPDIGSDERAIPTAADASIRGRLLTPTGRGLMNAYVILTNTNTGEVRTARSTSLGYFNFQNLQTGEFYVVNVQSKRYQFNNQSFTLDENIDDLVMTANGGQQK